MTRLRLLKSFGSRAIKLSEDFCKLFIHSNFVCVMSAKRYSIHLLSVEKKPESVATYYFRHIFQLFDIG